MAGARLEDAHGDGRILGEPGRDHVARGSAEAAPQPCCPSTAPDRS
jgi:hypothetical protein